MTALALGAVGYLEGLKWPLINGSVFAVWFALALAVVRRRGGRSWKAIERAYIASFGWAQWLCVPDLGPSADADSGSDNEQATGSTA